MTRANQLTILGCIAIFTCVLIMLPNKLPSFLTEDKIGILDMKFRYYIFLALLCYITVSHVNTI